MVKTFPPLGAAVLAALLAPCPVAAMHAWPLGPPPPLPPLPQQAKGWILQPAPAKPRWERVAQRQRLQWERVPSHERILPDTLAISEGPQTLELVQEVRPARRWEPVEAPRRVVGRVWFRF
jgi:hypothetical protein